MMRVNQLAISLIAQIMTFSIFGHLKLSEVKDSPEQIG